MNPPLLVISRSSKCFRSGYTEHQDSFGAYEESWFWADKCPLRGSVWFGKLANMEWPETPRSSRWRVE